MPASTAARGTWASFKQVLRSMFDISYVDLYDRFVMKKILYAEKSITQEAVNRGVE
jgi:hypothetical protein